MKFKNYLLSGMLVAAGSLSAQTFTMYNPDPNFGFGNNTINDLVSTNNALVGFLSGDSTLVYFNNGSFTYDGKVGTGFYNYSNGTAGRELDQSPNGDLWLAHSSTVDHYDGSTVTNYNTSSSDLQDNSVKDMAINNDGVIFFAMNNGNGISTNDNGTWTHYNNFTGGLSDLNTMPFPKFLEADPVNNNIVLGEYTNVHIISATNTMTSFDDTNFFPNFNSNDISSMAVTQDGKIWIGVQNFGNDPAVSGIFMYDGSTWTHYNTNNSDLPGNSITAMTSIQNYVYFANQNMMGLHQFDGTNVTTYDSLNSTFNQSSIFSGFINEMVAHDNKIYMAKPDGLVEFDFPGGNGPSSVNEDELNAISLYPNPANDKIIVQSKIVIEAIEIYSLSGMKVVDAENVNVDISNLNSGLYIVKVSTVDGNTKFKKFQKR